MIAERIKFLRETKGLTQAELARKMGISRSGVNAWELGISVPSTQYLTELSALFDVSTDWLLGVNSKETLSVTGLDDEDIEVVYALIDHLRKKNKVIADFV